jgi:hypothetical protein
MTPAVQKIPNSKVQYCQMNSLKSHYRELSFNPENHLSFGNYGGIQGQGVCWWHALFQRASLYLVVFRPELPKPSLRDAQKIIHAIAAGKRVVEVPGYENLWSFSKDWEAEIQKKLESWQLIDGTLKFAWIKGLSGKSEEDPDKIKNLMEDFFYDVESLGNIEWSMWQLKGISSHGVLFTQISRPTAGYQVSYLDSNYVGTVQSLDYIEGDRFISNAYGNFVAYPGRRKDLKNFAKAAQKYCQSTVTMEDPEDDVLDLGIE